MLLYESLFTYKEKTIQVSGYSHTVHIHCISVLYTMHHYILTVYLCSCVSECWFLVKTVAHDFSDNIANSMIKIHMIHPINTCHDKVRMEIP